MAPTGLGAEERELLERAARTPWDASIRLQLGQLQAALLKYPEAAETLRRSIVLDPDNPHAWLAYGSLIVSLHEGEQSVDSAYHRAAKAGADDAGVMLAVIEYFGADEKHDIVLRYVDQSFNANIQPPRNQLRYLRALTALGRAADAERLCGALVDSYTKLAAGHQGVQREQLLIHRARLFDAAGMDADVDRCLDECARLIGVGSVDFDADSGLLPNTSARIATLQREFRGRDAFVFLPGPSVKDFAAAATLFADWDFIACSIAMHIDALEESCLHPIGRGLDLLWMSNPAHLRINEAAIVRTLERARGIGLISQDYAFIDYPHEAAFKQRFDAKLLWVNCLNTPPTPSAPLQFLTGNSMSVLLQVLLWAQPERIFLFGADGGGAPPEAKQHVYFDTPDPSDGPAEPGATGKQAESLEWNPQSAADATRRFRLEAREADRMITMTSRILNRVFGLRIPRFINCSPYSEHTAFEKMSIVDALRFKPEGSRS
jgi:tetratricopeptide (TPR) repeat protein